MEARSWTEDLPLELLEMALAQLPLADLLQVAARVCKRWYNVINNPNFVPWKKIYYRYKMLGRAGCLGDPDSDGFVTPITFFDDVGDKPEPLKPLRDMIDFTFLDSASVRETFCLDELRLDQCIPFLASYIARVFSKCDSTAVFGRIEKHRKYELAAKAVSEKMPELIRDGRPSDSSAIAILCSIAEDVWDVREIISTLLRPSLETNCTAKDISELLYAIALAFLYFSRKTTTKAPIRLHYNVFHALYLFENDWSYDPSRVEGFSSPKKNQKSLMDFGFRKSNSLTLTAEQQRIISHPIDKTCNATIKIVAFAGTGKTTTLIKLCERNPELKFLVVMYNKAVKEHACTQFPKSNVSCYTAHGMAYQKCGFRYNKKMTSNLKSKDIMDSGLMSDSKGRKKSSSDNNYQRRAAQILKTLENFMNSPDEELTTENVPGLWFDHQTKTETVLSKEHVDWVLADAKAVWDAMIKEDDDRVRLPHDGYLKCWQLRKPNLQWVKDHDVLLIDEGQDMNPAMLDIFLRQETPKIIVGDPNQQIYGFRGAINALGSVECTHTFYLTQSFRFGPEIAFAAACCIEVLKRDDKRTLVGGKKTDHLVSALDVKPGPKFGQVAVISRSNVRLFHELVRLICNQPSDKPQVTASFAGGMDGYNFRDYIELYYLKCGQNEKMTKWKGFKCYDSFRAFAKNTNDPELLTKLEIVDHYTTDIPRLVQKIEDNCSRVKKGQASDYVFSTAHKAKGLEWTTVILLDGFMLGSSINAWHMISDEEKNILYVALTRAKKYLAVSLPVFNLLTKSDFHFERVVLPPVGNDDLECPLCMKAITKRNPLHLESQEVSFTDFYRPPGVLCSLCASSSRRSIVVSGDNDMTRVLDRSRMFLSCFCRDVDYDSDDDDVESNEDEEVLILIDDEHGEGE